MKIVLINPPLLPPRRANFPPIGLGYISAVLKKAGYHVQCIDACNMTWKLLEEKILESKPDVVGITCWTFARGRAFKTGNIARSCCPDAKIIIGGQHATFLPEQTMDAANADFVVLREGEKTIVELIQTIQKNGDFSKVKGIAYRDGDKIFITTPRPFISDLDTITFPDYDDFNLDDYKGLPDSGRRAAGIITSRGCPFDCNYCSSKEFWTRKWRYRSAENIFSEIEYLYLELGVRALMVFDDNFTVNKTRTIEVCKGIIDRKIDLVWCCIGSVRAVDNEILTWMKKAGCYQIQYGVESGSTKILKNINKGQTLEQIKNAFRWTTEAGMEVYAYLIVGAPGETDETINETIQLMKKIAPNQNPSGGIGILWILPGTKIYQLSKLQGIISDNAWIEKDDEYLYYTGEHTPDELEQFRMRLRKGLARNGGIFTLFAFLLRNHLKQAKIIYRLYYFLKEYWLRFRRFLTARIYPLIKGERP
jgi:anaerobic magnesium-protoporphyrin IX monomethyl ester cyclase